MDGLLYGYLPSAATAEVADELETVLFHATLGSLLEGKRNFTYNEDSNGTQKPARRVLEIIPTKTRGICPAVRQTETAGSPKLQMVLSLRMERPVPELLRRFGNT